MSDIAMNLQTNDILVTAGSLSLVTGDDEIVQKLQQSMQIWLGEWFLDTTRGVPYRQQILIKNPNFDLVQADLINAALSVKGVTEVTNLIFNYTKSNRSLSVVIDAKISTGQAITAQVSVSVPTDSTIQGTPY